MRFDIIYSSVTEFFDISFQAGHAISILLFSSILANLKYISAFLSHHNYN